MASRFICRRDGDRVQVFCRYGKDWTNRVPVVADALRALPVSSATLDGEGVVCDHHGVSYFDRLRSWRCWCVSFGGRPNLTPRPLARVRPSPVRARISSRSNSARPPSTVSISRPCGVGPFADCFPQPLARGPLEVVNLIQTRSPDGRILTETSRRRKGASKLSC